MRRSLLGALITTVTLMSLTTPIGAVPTGTGPVGVTFELYGSGISQGPFDFPLEQGQPVSVRTVTAAPGEAIDLGGEGATIVVVTAGAVSHYPDCTQKMSWSAGHTQFHSSSAHPGALTVNEGEGPATLVLVHSAATGAAPPAADGGHHHGGAGQGGGPLPTMHSGGHDHHGATEVSGCPAAGAPASAEPRGTGTAYNADTVMQQHDQQQLQVWRFRFEPGYTSDWHTHPGAVVAVQTGGVLENWNGCQEREVWDPGYSYFHSPGTHGRHQNMTNNKTAAPAELLGIFFNVPPEFQSVAPPVVKAPPPAECPSSTLTY